jgi:ATP-dependent RNA helicase DDX49/DBP8
VQFKNLSTHILVATDVAARGLDIPSVDLVVNFDVPMNATEYVHRVGRTSRTGRGGLALTFVAQYDVALVQVIEGEIGHRLEAFEINEGEALEAISKVFAARRAALLAIEGRRAAIEDRKR